jgi:hypothetical protein
MSFKWIYINITKIIPILRISLKSPSYFRINYLVESQKIFAISLCIILGIASTSNYIFSPTTNSHNASIDLVNAVKYVISQNPSKDSLILADAYGIKLLSAFSHGRWYNYPYGDRCSEVLNLALPAYYHILIEPSKAQFAIQEGRKSVLDALTELNVTCDIDKFYLVYDAVMVKHLYYWISIPSSIVETLSSLIGEPKVFGNVFVYSGYIPMNASHGLITQLDADTSVYDVTLNDFKSLLSECILEGRIIYDTPWNGLLIFYPNSSLTIKIDAKHTIINATLSCSIYRYKEYNNNSIQVSLDGVNWVTVWKANTTGTYADIKDLELPEILKGYSSFYLRFYSENVNNEPAYSMAIRTAWGNAPNGIKLKIFVNA